MRFFKLIFPALFLILIFSLIISTFFPQEVAHKVFYQAIWFKGLWGLLAVGLFFGTVNLLKRKSFGLAIVHSGIILILLGGFLGSFFGVEGFIELKRGETAEGIWIEDDLFQPLDFSVLLKDFLIEFYPKQRRGMRFVKSYKTKVSINKDGVTLKEATIEVNRPLTYKGFSFYQYGHDSERPDQTLLQVVKDPGLSVVYTGFLVLLGGMFFSFKKVFFSV